MSLTDAVTVTLPSLSAATLATDDILNAAEAQADLTVSGTSTAEAGQTVTVSLNGKDYTATVGSDGNWTLNVPAAAGTFSVQLPSEPTVAV